MLLALWPFALLYPAQVPFGLGQVGERALAGLQDIVDGTPFAMWLPAQSLATSPLSPLAEAWCRMMLDARGGMRLDEQTLDDLLLRATGRGRQAPQA